MPLLLGETALVLTKLEGKESFSSLYSYTLTAKTPANDLIPWQSAANVDIKALIGKEMTVAIELDGNGLDEAIGIGAGSREISGLVQRARFLGRDANQAIYEIIVRPWLYLTELTSDFKIFQQKNVVTIIDEVLAEYNFPMEKRLTGTYPLLDFQVQYGETDFNFIERLMEEWGIYWFFEHEDRKHKLVLVDHVGAHKRFASEAYHVLHYMPSEPKAGQEYITRFEFQETITSGRWYTNDYDFTKSRADISAIDVKPRHTSFNEMELYHWPGDYDQPAIGEQLAKVRMEERGALGSRASGYGELRGVVCGTNFELQNYPLEKANREYMVISSELTVTDVSQVTGMGDFSYQCHFTVQPTTKIYRHPQRARRPKTSGPQTAVVVGPPGEDIWTDTWGRIKVRFLWDRYGQNRETDSCWIRVSQAWAGNNFGGIYIPRVGHEVIVDFINGDPDRPLVIGSLYNNVTMPPWDLPENATQSGLVSRTVGGGRTNFNGIQFEDKPGLEQYWEQAERDMSRLTKRNESQTIGLHSDISVGATRSLSVGASSSRVVGINESTTVNGNSSLMVGAAYTINVAGAQSDDVGGAKGINVGGAFMSNVGGFHSLSVGGASAMNVGGAWMNNVGGYYSLSAGGYMAAMAGGAMSLMAGGVLSLCAGKIILCADHIVLQGGQVDLNPGDCCSCCSCGGGGGGGGGGFIAGIPSLKIFGFIGLVFPLPCLPIVTVTVTVPCTTATEPVPTVTTPEPAVTDPVPTATTPEPTVTDPVPTATTPEPTVTDPVPTATTPEPTVTPTIIARTAITKDDPENN
ncbi:type VI secretion system tip protein TssI/VgrG [Kalamiella sp. sgz302252]|uniref:type VI secretion system Vgr family protein n=1 Tax=Pantoea sp. sgz302252 TaxID=3341827 RepID=UPI0036D2712F